MAETLPSSNWIERSEEDGSDVLYLSGAWRLTHAEAIARRLRALDPRPVHTEVTSCTRSGISPCQASA